MRNSNCLRQFMDADAAVFHLTAVPFEANRSALWNFECRFEKLAITYATSFPTFYRDHDFVPIALLGELRGLFLRITLEDPSAALLVEEAPIAVGRVGLRSGDSAVRLALTTELDSCRTATASKP